MLKYTSIALLAWILAKGIHAANNEFIEIIPEVGIGEPFEINGRSFHAAKRLKSDALSEELKAKPFIDCLGGVYYPPDGAIDLVEYPQLITLGDRDYLTMVTSFLLQKCRMAYQMWGSGSEWNPIRFGLFSEFGVSDKEVTCVAKINDVAVITGPGERRFKGWSAYYCFHCIHWEDRKMRKLFLSKTGLSGDHVIPGTEGCENPWADWHFEIETSPFIKHDVPIPPFFHSPAVASSSGQSMNAKCITHNGTESCVKGIPGKVVCVGGALMVAVVHCNAPSQEEFDALRKKTVDALKTTKLITESLAKRTDENFLNQQKLAKWAKKGFVRLGGEIDKIHSDMSGMANEIRINAKHIEANQRNIQKVASALDELSSRERYLEMYTEGLAQTMEMKQTLADTLAEHGVRHPAGRVKIEDLVKFNVTIPMFNITQTHLAKWAKERNLTLADSAHNIDIKKQFNQLKTNIDDLTTLSVKNPLNVIYLVWLIILSVLFIVLIGIGLYFMCKTSALSGIASLSR